MTQSEKLKPCPFCGGEADISDNNTGLVFYVRCKKCRSAGPAERCAADSADTWNTRPLSMTGEGWQPIETAPKDGTRFFAWWPHVGKPVLAWFAVNGIGAGGWRFLSSVGGNTAKPHEGPTHWIRLPEPPAAIQEQGE